MLGLLGIVLLCMIIFGFKESLSKKEFRNTESKNSLLFMCQSYKKLLLSAPFMRLVISSSFAFGVLFVYIGSSASVFMEHFNLNQNAFAILFALNSLGFVIVAHFNTRIVSRFGIDRVLARGYVLFAVFMLLLAVSSVLLVNLFLYEALLFISICLLGIIMPNIATLSMALFREISGSVSSILGSMQFGMAGLLATIFSGVFVAAPRNLAVFLAICAAVWAVVFFGKLRK